jgi:hypothetical protein
MSFAVVHADVAGGVGSAVGGDEVLALAGLLVEVESSLLRRTNVALNVNLSIDKPTFYS